MAIRGLEKTIDDCMECHLMTLQRALDKSNAAEVRLPLLEEYRRALDLYAKRHRYEKIQHYYEYLRKETGA